MDEVKKFAVFGNPVNHSLSPFIHKEFAKQHKINIQYKQIEPESNDFETHAQSFFSKKGLGANVTIPFKDQAFMFADQADDISKQCECANTLWHDGGMIKAFNTDGLGFISDLNNKEIILTDMSVLIIGAGGSARSIANSFANKEISSLTVMSRTQENIDRLSNQCSGMFDIKKYSEGQNFDLVINTTPVSMMNREISFPKDIINSNTISYDLFYARNSTKFQTWSKDNGAKNYYDGIGMLIEQAALSYKIWNDFTPDTKSMEKMIRSI